MYAASGWHADDSARVEHRYSLRRISALKPSHIACEAVMAALLRIDSTKRWQNLLFEDPLPGIHHSGSHTYPPDGAALLLFSAVRPPKNQSRSLRRSFCPDCSVMRCSWESIPAIRWHIRLALCLRISPRSFCTLLAGATYVHAPREIQRNPRILGQTRSGFWESPIGCADLLLKRSTRIDGRDQAVVSQSGRTATARSVGPIPSACAVHEHST